MFYAKDAAGNQSPTQTTTYTIDTIPPSITSVNPITNADTNVVNKVINITFSETILWIIFYQLLRVLTSIGHRIIVFYLMQLASNTMPL